MEPEYVPKTLDEAHEFLDNFLQDKEVFKNCPEEDVIGIAHMGLGRWLRNKWSLWWSPELYQSVKEKTPEGEKVDYPATMPELVKYFNDLGVEHADDMSGIVIISYHKKLNNRVYDMDADIKEIKAFYEEKKGE